MKVGVVGSGKIAERHIAAYKKLNMNEIVVTDIRGSLSKKVSRLFEIEVCENIDLMLGDERVQIIDICTPVPSHKEIIVRSLRNNKHVLCEKPLCMNLEEAYKIKAAVETAQRYLMVGHLYRFHPAMRKAKEWLTEGLIGKPHLGILRIGGRGGHQAWKHSLQGGGGAINEMLVHELDLILWYLGGDPRVKVLSKDVLLTERLIGNENIQADAEDFVLVELEQNGTRVLCEADLLSPMYSEYLELHGENGSIFTSILSFLPTVLFLKVEKGIYNQGNNFFNFEQVNLFELEIAHFLDCIRNGDENMNSIDDSIEVTRIIEKLKAGTS